MTIATGISKLTVVVTSALLLLPQSLLARTWPDAKLDALDNVYFDRAGYREAGIVDALIPCSAEIIPNSGRNTGANWIRTVRILFDDSRIAIH